MYYKNFHFIFMNSIDDLKLEMAYVLYGEL